MFKHKSLQIHNFQRSIRTTIKNRSINMFPNTLMNLKVGDGIYLELKKIIHVLPSFK